MSTPSFQIFIFPLVSFSSSFCLSLRPTSLDCLLTGPSFSFSSLPWNRDPLFGTEQATGQVNVPVDGEDDADEEHDEAADADAAAHADADPAHAHDGDHGLEPRDEGEHLPNQEAPARELRLLPGLPAAPGVRARQRVRRRQQPLHPAPNRRVLIRLLEERE